MSQDDSDIELLLVMVMVVVVKGKPRRAGRDDILRSNVDT